MSTPAKRRGRRKLGLLAAVVGAFGLFLSLNVASASASVVCTFDVATGQVQIVVSDDSPPAAAPTDNTATVSVGGAGAILVNGAPCLDPAAFVFASTLNTEQINVSPASNGADGDDTLVINSRTGLFAPGAPSGAFPDWFSGSLNEIEFYVNLGFGFDTLSLVQPDGEDAITIGRDGGGFSPTGPVGIFSTIWDGRPANGLSVPNPTTTPGAPPNYPLCYFRDPADGDLMVNLNAFPADDDADIYAVSSGGAGPCATDGIDLVVVSLGGGDDFLTGKGGDGTGNPTFVPLAVDAGPGNDTVIGGLGPDTIVTGGGSGFFDGNVPVLPVVFGFQDDLLAQWECGFDGGDIVDFSAETGPLTITLNPNGSVSVTGVQGTYLGFEGVVGSQGDDTITGNAFDNLLVGAGGNDTIDGLPGNDCIDGDNVNGYASVPGTPGNDNLAGGLGIDFVLGGPADDTLDENKPLKADGSPDYGPLGNGADALDGGPGTDTVTYEARTNRTVVYLGLISTLNDGADTNADGLSNEFDDVFFTTENVITGSSADGDIVSANFVNNRSNNVFTDNGGNDCLEGGPGNDTFEQSSAPQGADVLIGNTGADTANYGDRTAAVAVSLDGVANDGDIATNEGDNVGGFSVSCRPQTILVNPPFSIIAFFFFPFEEITDVVNPFANFVDAPVAGPAPQICLFQDGIIVLPEAARQPQGLPLCPGETLGGDQAPLTNVDVENVNGGSGNDILVGDRSGNVLNGNGGDDEIKGDAAADQLNGGDGNDVIAGGAGNDAINGGSGTNMADYASAGAGGVGVQVNLLRGRATGEGNDTLKDIQNVNGSSFDDAINGSSADNVLNGRGGEDAISGNAGNDTINGGPRADQLSGQTGDDRIRGVQGNDAIQGGQGDDRIQGGQGRDTILGQKGNDRLYGNAQPDFLNGNGGNDICKPGSPGLARGDVVVNCER